MWHNSFICVTWRYMWRHGTYRCNFLSRSNVFVRHGSFIRDMTHSHVTRRYMWQKGTDTCNFFSKKLHVKKINYMWLIHTWHTDSYVRHDSFVRVTWLIHMWHDVICDKNGLTDGIVSPGAMFFCNMTPSNVTWLIHMIWLIHMWHDSFTCDVTLYVTKGELQR